MDIYQEVTNKIVAALETGAAPWVKPWTSSSVSGPYNAATGREYNGINWLVLSCSPYASQGWLTFKQAKELGGSVRKGEKGTHIVFWSFPKIKDKETGEEKVVPFAKGFTVFNVEHYLHHSLEFLKETNGLCIMEAQLMGGAQNVAGWNRNKGDGVRKLTARKEQGKGMAEKTPPPPPPAAPGAPRPPRRPSSPAGRVIGPWPGGPSSARRRGRPHALVVERLSWVVQGAVARVDVRRRGAVSEHVCPLD